MRLIPGPLFPLALSFGLAVVCAQAEDWPQWLGPNRDSVWSETGILDKFPEAGPPVKWRVKIGSGYSGPVVWKGRVYVMDRQLPPDAANPADPFQRGMITGGERVLCLNESDGKVLWQHQYECAYTVSYPAGPRTSPLASDGKLFTLGAEGNLFCLDAESGKVLWSHDFKKEFGVKTPMWGFAGHPLLEGNKLICLVGGAGTTLVAFDRNSGKELWRSLTTEEPGYSSPILCKAGGKKQLILWQPEGADSVDPETGKLYWFVPFKSRSGLTVSTPRRMGDLLFFTSFYNGSLMLRLDPDKPMATLAWQTEKGNEKDTTHLNSILCTPFLENGFIYGVCSYGQLRCLNAETGQRVWETLKATTSGEPVRWANAFIVKNANRFFLFNEKGDLIIAKLTPSGYEELSRAHLLEPANKDPGRPVVWSHPAFANRKIYARNDKDLICAELAKKP
ncbi:MAG TPA: PQQ-binding-like beta-propeller repeat protein [Verrucomicrobiae bacterium]|nr:PQQ-binding-like beta-propeller repeat protein [Verrucomicrobiae bacterium]